MLATRTSSLPLVPLHKDILDDSASINDRHKSQSHESFQINQTELVVNNGSNNLNVEIEVKPQHSHHHGHRYSIRKFKERLKHGKKRDKSMERNNKHKHTEFVANVSNEVDPNSEAECVSHDEKCSQSSKSENEDYPLTDDDQNSPLEDSAFISEKKEGFFRRMSVKVKQFVTRHDDDEGENERKSTKKDRQINVNDLTEDNNNSKPVYNRMTVKELQGLSSGMLYVNITNT